MDRKDFVTDPDRTQRFQAVVLPHLNAAYNLARWLAGGAQDADDIVQEAYLRALRFFDGFTGAEAGDARAWLLAIVRNTYFTEWRRTRGLGHAVEFDDELHGAADAGEASAAARPDADPLAILARNDERELVDRTLRALAPEFREVLVLRELEELSYREIAAVAGIPIGTVMSRIARGRRMFFEAFLRLGGERS